MSSVDGRLLPSRWTQPFGNTAPSELFMKYAALARQLGSDGSASSPSIFEYLGAREELPADEQSLELVSSETFDNGIVWLRYRFHKNK